jgi:hypothetical protein
MATALLAIGFVGNRMEADAENTEPVLGVFPMPCRDNPAKLER